MLNIDSLQADSKIMGLHDPIMPNQNGVKHSNKVKAESDVSSAMLTPDQTQKILNQELADKLEQRFGEEGVELAGLKAEDYTPNKVANNILNFIELGVSQAKGDEAKKERLEEARAGVEEGFKDAREILDSIGVLNGKVKEDIDETYSLIQTGLDRLADPEARKEAEQKRLELINQGSYIAAGSEETRQSTVEIMTKDGDRVSIDLMRGQKETSSAFQQTDGQSSVYGASYSSESYTSIEYKVNGELDEGEKAAIDDLLNKLGGVAKDFYQGDLETAFTKAKEIGFDTNELASFSADLSHQQSAASAVSSYETIQRSDVVRGDNGQDKSQGDENKNENAFVRDAANFMSKVDQLMKHNAFELFANAEKSMVDLFKASIELQDKKDDDKESKAPKNNSINDIIAAVHGKKLTSEPEA